LGEILSGGGAEGLLAAQLNGKNGAPEDWVPKQTTTGIAGRDGENMKMGSGVSENYTSDPDCTRPHF
jgi:hypothetical protein